MLPGNVPNEEGFLRVPVSGSICAVMNIGSGEIVLNSTHDPGFNAHVPLGAAPHFMYAPGGEGAVQAQQEFETLLLLEAPSENCAGADKEPPKKRQKLEHPHAMEEEELNSSAKSCLIGDRVG